MKKIINLICIFSLCCSFSFASSSDVANRNTALRCLKLAETCLLSEDYENAYNQAVLGLSYDEDISDLIYIKAHSEMALKANKREVIQDIEKAFEKNEWVGYTVNGARLLYADLLSDVGRYEESMKVLDEKPFILTADAEFIRIKNLYRMQTKESVSDARLKVNTSRRIYKNDDRFPTIFFMFELKYLQESFIHGTEYEMPSIVKTIASSYITDLPDYKGDNPLIEILAVFFASSDDSEEIDEQTRLLKAIASKNGSSNPLLSMAGLKVGLYSDQEAFDIFFESAQDRIELSLLESFALMITEDEVKKQVVEKLNNYEGVVYIDSDYDLQSEIYVTYKTGRPDEIKYDSNNDGIIDLFIVCDFGTPIKAYFYNNNTTVSYKSFPSVECLKFEDKDYAYNYIDKEFNLSPFTLSPNNVFTAFGLDFYIPVIDDKFTFPTTAQLLQDATDVELKTKERDNSKVFYRLLNGKPVYADFYNNDEKYAYCGFTKDFPLIRKVDYDEDGHFETEETFNVLSENEEELTADEKEFIENIFHPLAIFQDIYLSMVRVDRNANTFYEFTEQYIGRDGKITSWDNNDDGIIDSQFIRYPSDESYEKTKKESLKEDSIFFDENGEVYISINFVDKVPVKMNMENQEVFINAGDNSNVYWIDDGLSQIDEKTEIEQYIVNKVSKTLSNGVMKMEDSNGKRVSVIMVNDNIFIKPLPDTYIEVEEEAKEELKETRK